MNDDIRKFNWKTREYEKYEVPEGANIALIRNDMESLIQCAGCFKILQYGASYTSMELHNSMGLAYCVCGECYEKEWKRRFSQEKES